MKNKKLHPQKLLEDKVAAYSEKLAVSAKEKEKYGKELETIVSLYNEISLNKTK